MLSVPRAFGTLFFHPRSPQVVADVIAEAAVTILRGPDHDAADPDKAFRKWDAAVGSLNQNALDLPPLNAQMLSTCLMYASLHASKEDSYYQAYAQFKLHWLNRRRPLMLPQSELQLCRSPPLCCARPRPLRRRLR